MDRRRAIIALVGLGGITASSILHAEQSPKVRRIAFLHPGTQAGNALFIDAFRAALKDLGYAEGRNISIDFRWANDKPERLETLATDLARLNPEVLVTASSIGVAACKRATSSIPIVFATAAEVEKQGFVTTLQRPGGNVTGVTLHVELVPKLVELVRDVLPRAQRLAILVHEADSFYKFQLDVFLPSARRFNFKPLVIRLRDALELDRAFTDLIAQRADGIVIPPLTLFGSIRKQLADHALNARLPLFSNGSNFVENGGLLSYGTSVEENYRRAASLVDRILRGADPAGLPVEQPERFLLVVNQKTARAIGVTLPKLIVLRADRVIE